MKHNDILFLLISTTCIVFFWIVFNIYHKSVTSTIPETINVQILPIDPSFDEITIKKIKERKAVEPLYNLSLTQAPISGLNELYSSSSAGTEPLISSEEGELSQ